jgi:molybdopterin-guanine dinucleotide biosynthesis protein A
MIDLGAIILAGGKSSRMGRDKASLDFEGETLLERVTRRVAEAVEIVVVVAAPGQEIPRLAANVRVVRDDVPDQGPLRGIATGLATLEGRVEAVFVGTTDAPFLRPAFVARLAALRAAGDRDAVIPRIDGVDHPLSAVYATRMRATADDLLARNVRRARALGESGNALYADRALLLADPRVAETDPELASLHNLNTPEAYEAARKRGQGVAAGSGRAP